MEQAQQAMTLAEELRVIAQELRRQIGEEAEGLARRLEAAAARSQHAGVPNAVAAAALERCEAEIRLLMRHGCAPGAFGLFDRDQVDAEIAAEKGRRAGDNL